MAAACARLFGRDAATMNERNEPRGEHGLGREGAIRDA
jgi:hypothetical protein